MKKRDFVKANYPYAEEAGERFTINPMVILAQSALETGWGKSVLCKEYHNYFGICAYGKPNKYWRGRTAQLSPGSISFRCYDKPLLSFMDYGRLIRSKYTTAADLSEEPKAFAKAIAYSSYISEVNGDDREAYRKAVLSICNTIQDLIPYPGIKGHTI